MLETKLKYKSHIIIGLTYLDMAFFEIVLGKYFSIATKPNLTLTLNLHRFKFTISMKHLNAIFKMY